LLLLFCFFCSVVVYLVVREHLVKESKTSRKVCQMIDLSMVTYSLGQVKDNLASAGRWLDKSIKTAREVGATSLADELALVRAYVVVLNPVEEPLQMLRATLTRHAGVLETAERKMRAQKILEAVSTVPADKPYQEFEDCVVGVLTELDKKKVF